MSSWALGKLYSRSSLSVLDFGAQTVRALTVKKKSDGNYRVLGGGEAPASGIEAGVLVNMGDAVESVVEALQKAERSSGWRAQTLYFNLDDPGIEGVRARGSKILFGEGQIQTKTIAQAKESAERLVNHFEKSLLYSKATHFLIDDSDKVLSPVGVFGKKLEVSLYMLLAGADTRDFWRKIFERSGVERAVPVATAWSVAYGLLPLADRKRKRLLMDLGADFFNGFIFENNTLEDHRLMVTRNLTPGAATQNLVDCALELLEKNPGVEQVLVTGDWAHEEKIIRRLREVLTVPFFQSAPIGIPKLEQPKLTSLVGLVHVAEELRQQAPFLNRQKNLWEEARQKTTSFFKEYF